MGKQFYGPRGGKGLPKVSSNFRAENMRRNLQRRASKKANLAESPTARAEDVSVSAPKSLLQRIASLFTRKSK